MTCIGAATRKRVLYISSPTLTVTGEIKPFSSCVTPAGDNESIACILNKP